MTVRVNANHRYDPAFGDQFPTDANAYLVIVTPEKELTSYQFILILPDVENLTIVISEIMESILDNGDNYRVIEVIKEHAEKQNLEVPIMSYDINMLNSNSQLEVIWLRPPLKKMN